MSTLSVFVSLHSFLFPLLLQGRSFQAGRPGQAISTTPPHSHLLRLLRLPSPSFPHSVAVWQCVCVSLAGHSQQLSSVAAVCVKPSVDDDDEVGDCLPSSPPRESSVLQRADAFRCNLLLLLRLLFYNKVYERREGKRRQSCRIWKRGREKTA